MNGHRLHPRSLGLDELPDPRRTHVCSACGAEGAYDDDRFLEPCAQTSLFDEAAQ